MKGGGNDSEVVISKSKMESCQPIKRLKDKKKMAVTVYHIYTGIQKLYSKISARYGPIKVHL
jgi:hypothetical protein